MARKRVLAEWGRCLDQAEHAGLRERHQLHRQAAKAARRAGPLRDSFESLAGPERARIRAELPEAKKQLGELEAQREAASKFHSAHPEALHRLMRLGREIDDAAFDMDLQRQPLDGIDPRRPELPQLDDRFQRHERVLERTIELDRGFGLEL